jgi:hypothetical protein
MTHIPQFAVVFFAISLVELLDNSTALKGYPLQRKKNCGVSHGMRNVYDLLYGLPSP